MNLLTMLRNASANIVRVVVNALAALLMPRLLLGTLAPEMYAVWLLIVQVGLYSGYLNFGISTIVGRSVAFYTETGDEAKRNHIVNTGIALLLGLALIAIALIAAFTPFFGSAFPEVPVAALDEARIALILVGSAMALRLPLSILSAVYIGYKRNEYPLALVLVEKVLLILAVIVAARLGGTLIIVAVAYTVALLCSFAIEIIVFSRFPSKIRFALDNLRSGAAREILRGAVALALVSFAALLITGLDTVIVGAFDFQSLVAFSLAVTLTSLVIQVQSAAVNVIMPVAASLSGQRNNTLLVSLLFRGTRYGTWILLLIGVTLVAVGPLFVRLWVGIEFVAEVMPLLITLVIATVLRQATLTSTNIAVGVGEQNKVVVPAVIGAVVNVTISVLATIRFGAIGAAFGTIIGGLVEISLHVFYVAPRILDLGVSPWRFLRVGYIDPWLCAVPAIVVTFLWLEFGNAAGQPLVAVALGMAVALMIVGIGWLALLYGADKARLQGAARRIQSLAKATSA